MNGQEVSPQVQQAMKQQLMNEMGMNRELLATQGAMEQYVRTPPETSDYIREFSMDHTFIFDETDGDLLGGTTPKESTLKNWGVNNPNYVFGNLTDPWERTKLELMELGSEMADSMYQINWELAGEYGLEVGDKTLQRALMDKQVVLNSIQQRIHAFMKKTRAKKGKERELMVTRSVIAGTTPGAERKKTGMLSGLMSGIFNR